MINERKYLDKYSLKDLQGYGSHTPEGIFRPLDVVDGNLVYDGCQMAAASKLRQQIVFDNRVKDWRDVIDAHRNGRRGRPRKGSR